jgi:putative transposase
MARLARVVLPGYPHHIIQQGNRRQDVFFCDDDYIFYLKLLRTWCTTEDIEILAYCLMTNHVHLILKPGQNSNLSRAIAETHRRYTRMINFRQNWRGYLWQGRFSSYPMEQAYLLKAAAYVELNPVKAKMVKSAGDYRWSSAHAHIKGKDSQGIVDTQKLLEICGDWKSYLMQSKPILDQTLESHLNTGRPLGNTDFIKMAEQLLGRDLEKKKPGPKSKNS